MPFALVGADGLDGVQGQVEQHLLELTAVDVNERQAFGNVRLELDSAGAQGVGLEREDALDEGSDRGRVALRGPLASEVEEVLDDPPRPVRLLDKELRVVAHVVGQAVVALQQLAEGDDRGKWIVQLVRDAGNELADRLHLLRLQQLRL